MIYVTIDGEEYYTEEAKITFPSGRIINITSEYIDLCENQLTETFLIDTFFENYSFSMDDKNDQ